MKFSCTCGYVTSDQTDYLPYKGYLLADQDINDVLDSPEGVSNSFGRAARIAYECVRCGRLFIEDQSGVLMAFVPETRKEHFLSSIHGSQWKAPLRAIWSDVPVMHGFSKGFLECDRGAEPHHRTFSDRNELERAYYEMLDLRRSEGTLRDALLRRNGAIIHQWPE